jgi:glycosyltransferase involved in cell wall biosynthesis
MQVKRKKILFIAAHRPDRAPGQRFRFEQYLDFLQQNGFDCELSYIISEEDDKVLYQKGRYWDKFRIHQRSIAVRKKDALRANDFDIIFVFREALLTGNTRFEKLFQKSNAKIVFDFDDAIWKLDVSNANRLVGFLKRPEKTAEIIALSDLVFAGNNYLADYARKYAKNVTVVPTTVDTSRFKPVLHHTNNETLIIGWSGSITTIKHFESAIPALRELKKRHGSRIAFKVIGDAAYRNDELEIKGIPWSSETEVKELAEIDIGIMPLPDNEWTKGKCGLKGLTYMALGIPTIMSPVGVNAEIIQEGINGFLANATEEWIAKMEQLIASEDLRKNIGMQAIKTVEERYSVNVWKHKYLNHFNELLKQRK